MNLQKAIGIFENARTEYSVPPYAEIDFIEKRYVEFSAVDETGAEHTSDVLVWVCTYLFGTRFIELTCAMDGTIVRWDMSA